MKMSLLVCITCTMVSLAPAAPVSASGPLKLSASQMDTATAGTGTASVWITSATAALQRSQFRVSQFNKLSQAGANVQVVVKISGLPVRHSFDSSTKIVIPSTGGRVSIGQTIFEGEMQ